MNTSFDNLKARRDYLHNKNTEIQGMVNQQTKMSDNDTNVKKAIDSANDALTKIDNILVIA